MCVGGGGPVPVAQNQLQRLVQAASRDGATVAGLGPAGLGMEFSEFLRNCRVSRGPRPFSWLSPRLLHMGLFLLLPSQRYNPLCRTREHVAMRGRGGRPQALSCHPKSGCVSEPRAVTASPGCRSSAPSPQVPCWQQMQGLHLPRAWLCLEPSGTQYPANVGICVR